MEDDVMIDFEAMTKISEDGLLSPTLCIYKVPQFVRRLNEDAYTPRVVSIGPFHNGDVRLQEMERHKQIVFKRFTQRAMTGLNNLVNFVKYSEPDVRASYSENIKLGEKKLVGLIFVDAAFIIELFLSDMMFDAKYSQTWIRNSIIRDLLLLENQLPFFFLEGLFNEAFPSDLRGDLPSFLELTFAFFGHYNNQNLEPNLSGGIKHFTDLLRFFHLPRKRHERVLQVAGDDILLYSAKALNEAGVELKVSTNECLLDLELSGSVLKVPHIPLVDSTERLFRNMIALDQCHYPDESYIIDYAVLLGRLINTQKDVDVLVRSKIVSNSLGDTKEVAKLFSDLRKELIRHGLNSNYLDICKRLNQFYENPCQQRKTTLRRDYCKTPWQTVVSIAGIILLMFTLIQTIFSILQVELTN